MNHSVLSSGSWALGQHCLFFFFSLVHRAVAHVCGPAPIVSSVVRLLGRAEWSDSDNLSRLLFISSADVLVWEALQFISTCRVVCARAQVHVCVAVVCARILWLRVFVLFIGVFFFFYVALASALPSQQTPDSSSALAQQSSPAVASALKWLLPSQNWAKARLKNAFSSQGSVKPLYRQ